MILISHRGNTEGPNILLENTPNYIQSAIDRQYMVEVDIWKKDDVYYIGHDASTMNPVDINWLIDRRQWLWIHCKNREALDSILRLNLHCFWHNKDSYTMTSKGYVWCYPGQPAVGWLSVAVMPEKRIDLKDFKSNEYFAVCSDFVSLLNT